MASISQKSLVVNGICEHDIDLLLLEEFIASESFRSWFFKKLKLDPGAILSHAERSVLTVNGESDLELTLLTKGKKVKILIENKIDAILQPNQAERYHERAKAYCDDDGCDRVMTVIIAPAVYFGSKAKKGFDFFIHYEAIQKWFQRAKSLGPRRLYKLAALNQAIDRGQQGWQLIPNTTTTNFWQKYWALTEEIAPALRMRKPDTKPATSNFINFWPLSFPSDVSLIHKVPYGRVDLQFAGMGEKLGVIQKKYGEILSQNMRIEKAGKSAAIRIEIEDIDMQVPFEESEDKVKAALKAALSLLQVYERVKK